MTFAQKVLVMVLCAEQGVSQCVNELGIGFMLAANYHPAMKAVAPVRRAIKIKTAFNFIGPMLNPARVPYAIVGVYRKDLVSSNFVIALFDQLKIRLQSCLIRDFSLPKINCRYKIVKIIHAISQSTWRSRSNETIGRPITVGQNPMNVANVKMLWWEIV